VGALWFVTGGARSGKSRFAERLAGRSGRAVCYLATLERLEPPDEEMRERIARHRADRPAAWTTTEAPRDLLGALAGVEGEACVLIDCLSLWVSNRLIAIGDAPSLETVARLERTLIEDVEALADAAEARGGPVILVTNEVGSAVVPESALGRAYRDLLGRVNQAAAARAERAWLLVAGRALELPPAEEA
jgi:adenosylcobinamide kinase/adenosylcobinamide-phosphate guanylyltransferase